MGQQGNLSFDKTNGVEHDDAPGGGEWIHFQCGWRIVGVKFRCRFIIHHLKPGIRLFGTKWISPDGGRTKSSKYKLNFDPSPIDSEAEVIIVVS